MSFQSAQFFIFLAAALGLYYLVPNRFRIPVLLAAGWYFYSCAGTGYLFLLIAASSLSYGAARLLEHTEKQGVRKAVLTGSLVLLFGNLSFFKFYNWFGHFLAEAALRMGAAHIPPDRGLVSPLGISFYTFMLSGLLIDVYRRKYQPEHNFIRFSLFSAFFPIVASGPIERGNTFFAQLEQPKHFEYDSFCRGASRMLWGFFKKFVVAETIAVSVGRVYSDLPSYTGPYLLAASLMYSYQLYCDFSGYSDIAVGMAQLFGIKVRENFERPFAARSFSDLWRRWHISLTGWFRDYLYFPLGGSRKGSVRTCLNIMIVFLFSGIWHGTGMTFVIWGLMNGAYMVLARLTAAKREALRKNNPLCRYRRLYAAVQIALVYLMFTSCIVFFRAANLQDALYVYSHLFTGWADALLNPAGTVAVLKSMNIGRVSLLLMLGGTALTEWVEWRASLACVHTGAWIRGGRPAPRMAFYYLILLLLALFGAFGTSSFIYFGF